MDSTKIPDDMKRFISLAVPSVPYLEAILLLRNEAGQSWDCHRLAARLYLSDQAASDLLVDMCKAGVLVRDAMDLSQYKYQPISPTLQEKIDRLALLYEKNLIEVTNLIHSKHSKKAQQFADAFLWRKDK